MEDGTTKTRRLRRPRLGTVLGGLALFVALQGTAFALPGMNSVNSGDIVDAQVRAADIHAGAVKASELATTWITGLGVNIPPGGTDQVTAACPVGAQAIAAGFNWDVSNAGVNITSMEITGLNEVTVVGFNDTLGQRTLSARAYCIRA
jgi:hypothetical protein